MSFDKYVDQEFDQMDQQLKYIDKINANPSKAVTFKEGFKQPKKVIKAKRPSISKQQAQQPTSYRAVKFDVYQVGVGSTKTESRLGQSTNQTMIRENHETPTITEAIK